MPTDEIFQQLHDKATRGLPLTAEERARLDAWYGQQDQEEMATLAGPTPAETLAGLRDQVAAATARLVTITQRIQALTLENDRLRQEIAALQGQITQRSAAQPA
jgi:hypothetical protein